MLIGQAVQFAFKKSLALFKMDAIKKALISAYQSVVTTLASIPFPFNIPKFYKVLINILMLSASYEPYLPSFHINNKL